LRRCSSCDGSSLMGPARLAWARGAACGGGHSAHVL
jgi:hypothetical protein